MAGPIPACYLCNRNFRSNDEAEDHFCSGCQAHVCSDCAASSPMGSHDPEDHLEEEDE